MSRLVVTRAAWASAAWGPLSIILFVIDAPVWLRLPVVGLFCLLGVGVAAVLLLEIRTAALAIAVGVPVGIAALIVSSLAMLYTRGFSASGTLVMEAALSWALSAWALWRLSAGRAS